MAHPAGSAEAAKLRRVLSLWDLIVYGIVLVMPIAAVPLFGVVESLSGGFAVTALLASMVAMALTAVSYGRMAALYPSAGSAYAYVSRGLNAHLGFLAGWAMLLDYLLVPLICTIYGALTLARLVPQVPYAIWCALFAAAISVVNLRGIRATALANLVAMIVMLAVILVFIVLAVGWLWHRGGWDGLASFHPFYRPGAFHWRAVAAATSVAALTYGGFDGVTTLAEEVRNPRRNVLIAAVSVCLFTGLFGGLQIYLAQRVWPDYRLFANLETAFMDVARVVGGAPLFLAMGAILLVANFGSGMGAQAGIARLLYGMGRDGALPPRFFARLDRRRAVPALNIGLVGVIAFLGALLLSYERAAELINFGAFLAFMGVNAALIRQGFWRQAPGQRHWLRDLLLPACGLLFCLAIWLGLSSQAKLLGAAWFAVGVVWDGVRTGGFRTQPQSVEFDVEVG